ncbi:hypothetical protein [Marinobacter shengliensis]|uniref:hypothetical protein n=1 Tax=Marinobacter shengliensis TaxID=1389223 RepID=UPI002572C189|nr:hypothetical protein [Marinobacter shengliensis]BEH15549.1 hypothetical protein MAALD49_29170 [Marinobacter shengliensis]
MRIELKSSLRGLLLSCALILTTATQAHQIWIEPADGGAALHYGYLDRNLRELSPGRLDDIVQPRAQRLGTAGNATALNVAPMRDRLALKLDKALEGGEAIVAVFDNGPVYERDGVGTHWTMASRFVADARVTAPTQLELDIVPTGEPGAFKVVLLGAPLANHTVRLANESGWGMDRRTDAEGVVAFPPLPWKGIYIVSTHHTVDMKGERDCVLADGTSEKIEHDRRGFGTTLTFKQVQGLDALPPLPVSPPYESGTRAQ